VRNARNDKSHESKSEWQSISGPSILAMNDFDSSKHASIVLANRAEPFEDRQTLSVGLSNRENKNDCFP
jgi:hypothetical protein